MSTKSIPFVCSYDPVHVHRRGVFDPRAPFAPMISECDGHIFTDVRHSHSQEVDVYREPWMQPNCIGVVGDKGQVAQLLRKPALLFDDKEENIDDLRSRSTVQCILDGILVRRGRKMHRRALPGYIVTYAGPIEDRWCGMMEDFLSSHIRYLEGHYGEN